MTIEQETGEAVATPAGIEEQLVSYLEERTKARVTPDQDLFRSGVVSSMFAMELIVYLEKEYQVSIAGGDLKLDNFRSVAAMTSLLLRLRGSSDAVGDA
ncbi:methoxymalonate biosynthesis protein hbmJ [Micromonospora sp. ATCC 39149]|uniref:Acyl carrier protein n=1 Tax=Micromonospora carbonacea TaxID=47853 RepID=A0A7D5YAI1_9ACTN|nr:acyl carrier protein [Micromonospora sp. ATCC 39149]EEP70231.1 methoxymalonate biosynthesis protein hbmJ [Micromonospora sp. ATCC 39149]QLJ96657.1 acyl carrier protein [Micromonospora carbonacea]